MYSQDEKTMAMIAHGSAVLNLLTGFGGIIVALVLYLTQKEKSAWVTFQALQSLVYQVATAVVFWILFIVSWLLTAVAIGCVCVPISMILGLAAVGYSVYGAYQCYQGIDFRYYWLGDWLARQQQPPTTPPPVA